MIDDINIEIVGLLGWCAGRFGVAVMERKLVGPCAIVHGVVRAVVIEMSGEAGSGSGCCVTLRSGRRVGLFGAIAGAEVLAHLLKGESALGDIGRTETTASVAFYKALGEEKVCYAFSPDFNVLLGS